MNRLLFFICLHFLPLFLAAETNFLKDLEEQGYCVIPALLSKEETETLYKRVWSEYIEKAWPKCKMEDRSNWRESFPMHNPYGVFAGPAGQTQVMWDLRQDPRIINIFSQIWNTPDLIVSMDGMCIMCPPEIREGNVKPWPHVDQAVMKKIHSDAHDNRAPDNFISESSLKTNPYTIQGQFLLEDSFEGDGGFYCIPKSHLRFPEFAPFLEKLADLPTKEERVEARDSYLSSIFDIQMDGDGKPYCKKQITAPKGSLILWDSRTLHWNQHPDLKKMPRQEPKVRMVGYLSYVPKARLNEENKRKRKLVFEIGASTGHNPAAVDVKVSKTFVRPGYEHYFEDRSFIQPEVELSDLGKSVLGI